MGHYPRDVPRRYQPAPSADVAAALSRVLAAGASPSRDDLKLLTRHFAAVLLARAPGRSVELRIPPYAAIQCVPGPRHTRGTPPGVVETDPLTWILLASGRLTWDDARSSARLVASGERTDLSPFLPLTTSSENS
jgi:Bacterial SCP ortholog